MKDFLKFLPFAIFLIFVDFSTNFLGNQNSQPKTYVKFSINKFCRSISYSQSQKNNCLLNFGFELPKIDPVRIAVVDSGIDKDHPYLKGYVSERGYDGSADATYSPFVDNIGHGTHVTGIILQQLDEISDYYQTIIPVEIVSAKFASDFEFNPMILPRLLKLLVHYEKFDIINISASGFDFNVDEYLALNNAFDKNTQVVVAAGNDRNNLNEFPNVFPCSYRLENVVCVGNSENDLFYNRSSNFGDNFVDVSTNGTNVFSTLPNNKWGFMSGTSMATPKITALMAFLRTKNGNQIFNKKDFNSLTKRTPASIGKSRFGEVDFFKLNPLMIGRNYE